MGKLLCKRTTASSQLFIDYFHRSTKKKKTILGKYTNCKIREDCKRFINSTLCFKRICKTVRRMGITSRINLVLAPSYSVCYYKKGKYMWNETYINYLTNEVNWLIWWTFEPKRVKIKRFKMILAILKPVVHYFNISSFWKRRMKLKLKKLMKYIKNRSLGCSCTW